MPIIIRIGALLVPYLKEGLFNDKSKEGRFKQALVIISVIASLSFLFSDEAQRNRWINELLRDTDWAVVLEDLPTPTVPVISEDTGSSQIQALIEQNRLLQEQILRLHEMQANPPTPPMPEPPRPLPPRPQPALPPPTPQTEVDDRDLYDLYEGLFND